MSVLTTPFDPSLINSGTLVTNLAGNPGTLLLLNDSACNLILTTASGSQRDLPAQTWRRLDLPQGDSEITWQRIGVLLIAVPNSQVYGEAYQSNEEISEVFPAAVVRALGGITALGALGVTALLWTSPDNWQMSEDGSGNLLLTDTTTGQTWTFARTGSTVLPGPLSVGTVNAGTINTTSFLAWNDTGIAGGFPAIIGITPSGATVNNNWQFLYAGPSGIVEFFDSTASKPILELIPNSGIAIPSGPITNIGGQATNGTFGVAPIVDTTTPGVLVSSTGPTTILTFTPAANGLYRVGGYIEFRGSVASLLSYSVTYTDDIGTPSKFFTYSGAGATNPVLVNGGTSFTPSVSMPLNDMTIYAETTGAITFTYNNLSGVPNDVVWAHIERLL